MLVPGHQYPQREEWLAVAQGLLDILRSLGLDGECNEAEHKGENGLGSTKAGKNQDQFAAVYPWRGRP